MKSLAAFSLLFLFLGCGTVDEPHAPAKCEALRAVYCGRVLACSPGSVTMAQCEAAFATGLDCAAAVDVGPTYDRCISELPGWDCATFANGASPPASCQDAISTR